MKKYTPTILSLVFMLTLAVSVVHGQTAPTGKLTNPFKDGVGDNLYTLMESIITQIILPIGGIVAVLAFIYVGFKYVWAQGKPKEIEEANRALLYVSIGTAILLGSWVIAKVIENTVNQFK